ncbi:unnamed protein product [Lathyrus sativus]|nr:unnamed protein product [Lathyrus sativus]
MQRPCAKPDELHRKQENYGQDELEVFLYESFVSIRSSSSIMEKLCCLFVSLLSINLYCSHLFMLKLELSMEIF